MSHYQYIIYIRREVQKQINETEDTDEKKQLIEQKKNLNETIIKSNKEEEVKRINNVVEEISKEGIINCAKFWEFRKRIQQKKEEVKTTILNEEGKEVSDTKEIL